MSSTAMTICLISRIDAMKGRIQALTIELMTQFMSLREHVDEYAALELGLILCLKKESERCCTIILDFLGRLRQQLLQISRPAQDNRAHSISINSLDIAVQTASPAQT